ncbi:MAG: ribonuclease J [Holosporales bacterium]|jgi:ribonuclease J|nr:ribonuclease J [Holosporales bacterium]
MNLFKEGLYFLPLGGCGKFGMNMGVYALNGKLLVVDMGLSFSSFPGQELLLADPKFLVENKNKIAGVVITHMHEDHLGAVPYIMPLIENVPVYVGPMCKSFLREKLSEFDLQDKIQLNTVHRDEIIDVAGFKVKFFSIPHSVPESKALIISTPFGKIFHTGDWNLDPSPIVESPVTQTDIKSALDGDESVLALVCDSTNVHNKSPGVRETQVREEFAKLIKSLKGHRIIFSCFSSNIARIESCALAAQESGRKVCIVGRSIKRMERIAREHGYLTKINTFFDERKIKSELPEKTVLICTGSQGEKNSALYKLADDAHNSLKLAPTDVVVFSARVIPGNEKVIIDLQNKLIDKNVRIITSDLFPVHASGHPSQEEIKQLYDWINPSVVVPMHGDLVNLLEHANFAKECGIKLVVVPRNGYAIKFAPGNPTFQESTKYHNGVLTIDGNKLVPLDGAIQKDKLKAIYDGIVFITISETDIKNRPYEVCEMTFWGLFEPSQSTEQEAVRHEICSLFNEMLAQRDRSKDIVSAVVEIAKLAVRKVFSSRRDKKPVVVSHILDLF